MPSLDDVAQSQTSLTADDVAWLQAVVTDWQIIADLSFSDLVLWMPDAEAKGLWAGAQIRPTTGPTTLLEDMAGTFLPMGRSAELELSLSTGRVVPRPRRRKPCSSRWRRCRLTEEVEASPTASPISRVDGE